MERITNKTPIVEQRQPLIARSATAEDQDAGMLTTTEELPNQGQTFELILQAMSEIQNHIKKCSDVVLTAGNFYFKIGDSE